MNRNELISSLEGVSDVLRDTLDFLIYQDKLLASLDRSETVAHKPLTHAVDGAFTDLAVVLAELKNDPSLV